MQPTVKAILARFNGNRNAARNYCVDLSISQTVQEQTLSSEYWQSLTCCRQKGNNHEDHRRWASMVAT